MATNLEKAVQKAVELLTCDVGTKALIEQLKSIHSFGDLIKFFKILWTFLKRLVLVTEWIYKEYHLVNETERIEVAANILDNLIVFRGWMSIFEPFDQWLFKMIISAAVQALNDKYGNDWLSLSLSKV